jgi:hypothetical protein
MFLICCTWHIANIRKNTSGKTLCYYSLRPDACEPKSVQESQEQHAQNKILKKVVSKLWSPVTI